MFPEEISEPFLWMELAAITVTYCGTLLGGPELVPGSVVHDPPQATGFGLVVLAKPLKEGGAVGDSVGDGVTPGVGVTSGVGDTPGVGVGLGSAPLKRLC